MGTEKRERQKANRAKKLAEEARQAKVDATKRNVVRLVVGVAAAFGVVLLIAWVGGAFDGDGDESIPTTPPTLAPLEFDSTGAGTIDVSSIVDASATAADSSAAP